MESLGGKKKNNLRDNESVQKGARAALQAAIVAFTLASGATGHHEVSQAGGRRFAVTLAEGLKMSDTIKPGIVAEDTPDKNLPK